jgi:hypothetical protein
MVRRSGVVALAGILLLGTLGAGPCVQKGPNFFGFLRPTPGFLTSPGVKRVELMVPFYSDRQSLHVSLNGADVTPAFQWNGRVAWADLDVAAGAQSLAATITLEPAFLGERATAASFDAVALRDPDVCEILNDAQCLLPFPSSRYQHPDPGYASGVYVEYPPGALPNIVGGDLSNLLFGDPLPLRPDAFNYYDGSSPGVQPLMHFPSGVDLAASDAPRLLESTRNFDLRSLEADSPFVLLDATTGERVAHFVENDANAAVPNQATILRPGRSLLPAHRYIVAVRNLVAPGGAPVAPEPVFRALRDAARTDIAQVEARRAHFESSVFPVLAAAGIARHDLVLAFDFTVASDSDLTYAMLGMRDQAFAWLATQAPASLFTVTEVNELSDCSSPDDLGWREVKGSFRVPNFLSSDPAAFPPPPADPIADTDRLGFLAYDPTTGQPYQTGIVNAPFGIAIPCAARQAARPGLVLGHGLFGSGSDFPRDLVEGLGDGLPQLIAEGLLPPGTTLDYVAAGTHWSGLSTLEVPPIPDEIPGSIEDILNDPQLVAQLLELVQSFIGQIFIDFNQFAALPDRLRQGQLHALVLARMLHTGVFNAHPCFQRLDPEPADCRSATPGDPATLGVLAANEETYYFGASLGGIMGLMFAALSPDVERVIANVPSINFSLILQRSQAFAPFGLFLSFVEPDPMTQLVGLHVLSEIWARGESVGYANHVTGAPLPPLPGTNAKHVLLTPGRFDPVVPPLGAQVAAATLEIPNLVGSVETDLPLVPDVSGPLLSAHVLYDTGGYVLGEDDAFIPPLENRPPASDGGCNPHGRVAVIPAALRQLVTFLAPGGEIENFCNGLCDAAEPLERPNGEATRCDPTP